MKNKTAIESLSMDLLRVALGYQRGSKKMAERFSQEALMRIGEIETKRLKPNFSKILKRIPKSLKKRDNMEIAEDALMYSTICKNYITLNA